MGADLIPLELQSTHKTGGVYPDVGALWNRLRCLAPLPTIAPESAGLCAWKAGSIVSGSLMNQRSGLVARLLTCRTAPCNRGLFGICFMAVMYRASSDAPVLQVTGLPTRVWPPLIVNQNIDTESPLANLSETLASANVMVNDLAFDLEGSRRHFLLGIQQLIELGTLLANRALDNVETR